MAKSLAIFVIVFLMLVDLESVFALDMPKVGGNPFGSGFPSNFPSTGNFPFPSKTPKPSSSATPAPTGAPTATPIPTTVFEIIDVDPSSANFDETFTIYGTNLGTSGSVNFRLASQSFSSGSAPIVSWGQNQITAKVPGLKKGSYRIQVVRQDGQKSNEEKFSIKNGMPTINFTSISAVNGEFELTFQGTEFGTRRGTMNIYDGSTLVGTGIIKSWSSSRVRFDLPNLPRKNYGFQIVTSDGRKSALQFFSVGN